MDLRIGIVYFIAIVFSLSIHEWAHAYSAYKLGDSTARDEGRVTWNPMAHLDPMGTVMLIIMAFSSVGLGWAKPVPVNPLNLKQPRKDLVIISFAGPASNLIQAFVGMFLFALYYKFQLGALVGAAGAQLLFDLLKAYVFVNISLFLFNMLPFYPLDGSKIYSYFLPKKMAFKLETQMIQWGMKPLIVLIVLEYVLPMGPLSLILGPVSNAIAQSMQNVIFWSLSLA